jgi:hypothetical protein
MASGRVGCGLQMEGLRFDKEMVMSVVKTWNRVRPKVNALYA